jgi:tetratricopeptide (TPR) repeat protein
MRTIYLSLALILLGFQNLKAQQYDAGMKALDFEKYEQARNYFKSMIQQEPSNGILYFYLGQAYVNLIQLDSAETSYQNGIANAPNHASNYAGLGELRLMEGKKDLALTQFNKALSFSKTRNGVVTDIQALELVASAMVNNAQDKMLDSAEQLVLMGYEQNKKNYNFLIAAGDVYLERNDGGNAATFYERAIALEPNNPKAYSRVAVIWLRVKNYEAAQTDLNRAFEKDPNYASAWKYQAELHYAKRNFAKAKEAFSNYLNNSEPSTANQIRFARILFLSKDYESALEKIEEIQKTDKKNNLLFKLKAYAVYEIIANKTDTAKANAGLEALTYYFSKTDSSKITATDYLYLGRLESKVVGKDSLASVHMSKALEIDPSQVEVYTDIAKLLNKLKKFKEAGDMFKKYIGLAKKPSIVDYYLMGKAYYFGKAYYDADTAFAKVNEMKADYAEAYYWRAMSLSSLDPESKTDLPKPLMDKYIELQTADAAKYEANKEKWKKDLINAYSYLGYYYLVREKVADNKTKAKENYKKVLELDPENVNAKKVLTELK